MILDLVRMKGKSLRPKLASILTSALISGLLVSIPVPAMAAACVPTSTTATVTGLKPGQKVKVTVNVKGK